jgi:TRAP-type uncharacterized transport system fused permease subunit
MDLCFSCDLSESLIFIVIMVSLSGVVTTIYFALKSNKTKENNGIPNTSKNAAGISGLLFLEFLSRRKYKNCPVCDTRVPYSYKACSSCGAEFPEESHADDQERARQRLINKYRNEMKK